MAQKHQMAAWSTCPSCEEPLESGDLFCGACGHDLSVAPVAPDDRPTIAMAAPAAARSGAGAPAAQSVANASPVEWPAVQDGTEAAAVQLPGELPGLDSAGAPLNHGDFELPGPGRSGSSGHSGSAGGHPADIGASGARVSAVHDQPDGGRPAAPAGRPGSPVPDPRTAVPEVSPPGAPVCVACRSGRVDPDGYCENCGHAQPRDRDHMEQELDAVAAVTDRGLRHHRNEDAFAVSAAAGPDGSPAVIAIVCDGVSSATRPDEASAAAAAAANESLLAALPRGTHPQQAMHDAIVTAAQAVDSLAPAPEGAREHPQHHQQNAPACTIVAAVVTGGLLVVGWIGDSRAYWVPDDREGPARLTEDDSWAEQMVTAGLMTEAEAYADERAHAITGWLGADAYELEPHTASFKPDRPGVVVVCTDGLWNYAEGAAELAAVVPADAAHRPLHAAQVLVGHALDGGGHDNVTVAVVPFAGTRTGAGSGYGTA